MPNIYKFVDNIAATLCEKSTGDVWFTKLNLTKAYNQLADNFTSVQCNFIFVDGNMKGNYQFHMFFYGLGNMPNEFQRVMESTTGNVPYTNCYLNDILIASKGEFSAQKYIVNKF